MNQALEFDNVKISGAKVTKFEEFMKVYKNLGTPEFKAEMRANVSEHGTFDKKFISSSPYHYFLTSGGEGEFSSDEPYSVAFHEIIDNTNGEIVDSLHLNFIVELLWIIYEYVLAAQNLKMTIVYGTWLDESLLIEPKMDFDIPLNIKKVKIKTDVHGCHRSKISIFKYVDNKIRIIISNANMQAADWQYRTHGIWISPFLPLLPETAEDTDGESPTNFKKDFLNYLKQYKNEEIFEWQALIHRTDCSAINVFFIASVPGRFEGPEMYKWGHKKLDTILAAHASLPEDAQKWPIILQCSAIGFYGENYHTWLSSHIVAPMSREKDKKVIFLPEFKFIYPTKRNFSTSYDTKFRTTPLMYSECIYLKQKWLKDYSYQWKADEVNRTRALPRTTYTRISPDETEISWFILTSANVGKSAWGKMVKEGKMQYIANYEAGVVFIPQVIINQATFPIKPSTSSDVPVFLLPFDLPLTKYEEDDEPYVLPPRNNPSQEEPETVIETVYNKGNEGSDEDRTDEENNYAF